MNTFKIKTYQPSLSSFCYLNEINNKNYLDINKFIGGNDNNGLNLFFNSLLEKKNFNIIDNFFALLYLRFISVGSEFKVKIENNTVITVNLLNILERLLNNIQQPIPEFKYKDLSVKFKLPKQLYHDNFIVFLYEIIDDFTLENHVSNFNELSEFKKINILKNLKKSLLNDLKDHIKKNTINYKLIDIDEDIGIKNYTFSFYDNSAFFTIKFLYKNDITSLYNKLYFCVQKLNLTYNDYCNMTPAESDILLVAYKRNNTIK